MRNEPINYICQLWDKNDAAKCNKSRKNENNFLPSIFRGNCFNEKRSILIYFWDKVDNHMIFENDFEDRIQLKNQIT